MARKTIVSEGEGVMPVPSLSEFSPSDEQVQELEVVKIEETISEVSEPEYSIVGVERTPDSKIWFQGRYWNLDRLSAEDVNHLSNFPEAFPYLKIG